MDIGHVIPVNNVGNLQINMKNYKYVHAPIFRLVLAKYRRKMAKGALI